MRSLEWLNAASEGDFVDALANMFEHSPWIPRAAFKSAPFASLRDLRDALLGALSEMPAERRIPFIQAHPDLANKVQRAEGLTADSIAEQDGAGLDRLSDKELSLFQELNTAYKTKFGFPFILCARRHTKDSILDEFSRRLAHSSGAEEAAAFSEVGRIATLRLAQLVSGPDFLPVHGTLSAQVIHAETGEALEGVSIELVERSRWGETRRIAAVITNATGGSVQPLVSGRPVPIGDYEIWFDIRSQLRNEPSDRQTFDRIPVNFRITEPEGRLDIRLSVAPSRYEVSLSR